MIKKDYRVYFSLIIPISYFALLWGISWGELTIFGTRFSTSYIFDLAFAIAVLYIYQTKDLLWENKDFKGFIIRAVLLIGLSWLCNQVMITFEAIHSPFPFLSQRGLKLLLLAPLFEELIFRGALFEVFRHIRLNSRVQCFLNALLFSLSHAFALTILDDIFHAFIYFQLIYTFILGWVCTKSRISSRGLVAPIILHFFFNLIFYIYVN